MLLFLIIFTFKSQALSTNNLTILSFSSNHTINIHNWIINDYLQIAAKKRLTILSLNIKGHQSMKFNGNAEMLDYLQNFTFTEEYKKLFIYLQYLLMNFCDDVKADLYDYFNNLKNFATIAPKSLLLQYGQKFYEISKSKLVIMKKYKYKFCEIEHLIYDLKYQKKTIANESGEQLNIQDPTVRIQLLKTLKENVKIETIQISEFLNFDNLMSNISKKRSFYSSKSTKETFYLCLNADFIFFEFICQNQKYDELVFMDYLNNFKKQLEENINSIEKFEIKEFKDNLNVEFQVSITKNIYLDYYFDFLTKKFKTNVDIGSLTDKIFELQKLLQFFLKELFRDAKNE